VSAEKSKATLDELNDLHGLLARELAKKIRSGDFTAADMNVARAFLKDNNVEQAALPGTPLRSLADSLPFAAEGATH
jgi:hypothetical protein